MHVIWKAWEKNLCYSNDRLVSKISNRSKIFAVFQITEKNLFIYLFIYFAVLFFREQKKTIQISV